MPTPLEQKTRPIDCPSCGASTGFAVRHLAINTYRNDSPLRVVSCARCGLVFLNPQYTDEAYADFYAGKYYQSVSAERLERNRTELANSYLRHYQDVLEVFANSLRREDRILDVGSGHGTWLNLLFRFAPGVDRGNVTALEPSSEACGVLRRRFPDIRVLEDVLSHRRSEAKFDAIVCGALIEHLTDPHQGLVDMNGMLKTGGRLLLVTPSMEPRSFRFGLDRFFKFVHTAYFTTSTLESVLAKAGFAISHCRVDAGTDLGMLWCPTILLVASKVRDVEGPHRVATKMDTANAAATAALFATRREAEVAMPLWRSLLLKVPRAAYRITMPQL
jgi:SAM-dependent methyltransferase